MTENVKTSNDVSLETPLPEAGASLESILCTEELERRRSRPPDYEKENRALVKLVSALADSPRTIFQTLAETIQEITQCDSAGLSLLTRDGKTPHVDGQWFYWPAICGMWNPHVGGGTPRNFGPCGDVLDQNRTLLFTHFERRYPYLMPVSPAAEECLLVPFYVGSKAVGTIWGIMHSSRRKFDAEDNRVMGSLGKFASSAYQARMREAEVRELASGLEAKIRRLVEANVVGIVMWNLEGAITGANEAFLRMVQYSHDDLASGRVRWTDLTPAEWRDCDERAIADLKGTGICHPFEKQYFRKDGSRVPVLLGGALFEGGGNEGVAFVLDLTEQKQVEEALRRSESYLAQAQRLAHIGSWVWELPATNALYLSEEWYRVFGFDPRDGMPSWEQRLQRVHPEDRARWQATIDRAIAEKLDFDVEFRILCPDAQLKFIHSVGRPVVSPSGELLQFVGVTIDVTENRVAEAERERLRQELAHLAHLNRVSTLGELTASLAHEIKQPIGAAVTNAETCARLLDRDQPDLPEAREAALEMARVGRRAADIVDRLRLLYQKGSPQLETVDVNQLVKDMVIVLHNEAKRHSVTIRTDLAEGLPKVMADRVQLQQALMNLMLNGIEAMRDITGELSIKVQVAEDGQLLISVTDAGAGLPADNIEKVFDAFFTTKVQGTGLGLAITRSIIASHGGRVWATRNSGRGATFHFTLPITVAVAA